MEDPNKTPILKPQPDETVWLDRMWDINKALAGNTLGQPKTPDELKALIQEADDIAKSAREKYGEDVPPSVSADLGTCARLVEERGVPTEYLKHFQSQKDS